MGLRCCLFLWLRLRTSKILRRVRESQKNDKVEDEFKMRLKVDSLFLIVLVGILGHLWERCSVRMDFFDC